MIKDASTILLSWQQILLSLCSFYHKAHRVVPALQEYRLHSMMQVSNRWLH